jgi:hypothetical protein
MDEVAEAKARDVPDEVSSTVLINPFAQFAARSFCDHCVDVSRTHFSVDSSV